MAQNARRKRAAIIRHLQAEARLLSKFAASTTNPMLRAALLRLVASQIEVAAILEAQNADGGDR